MLLNRGLFEFCELIPLKIKIVLKKNGHRGAHTFCFGEHLHSRATVAYTQVAIKTAIEFKERHVLRFNMQMGM